MLKNILTEISVGKKDLLEQYIADARGMVIVVGQGIIGEEIDKIRKIDPDEGVWALILNSRKVALNPQFRILSPLYGGFLSNPGLRAGGVADVLVNSAERTRELEQAVGARLADYEQKFQEQSKVIQDLEYLFRQKLPIEAPATLWEKVAQDKNRTWRLWLGLFALLAVGPLAAMGYCWSFVSGEITKLVGTSSTFSLGALAVVTVPVILYGWLLKNVSRVFIQQMNLADDSAHRRALTITWLGMVAEKKFEMTKEERALALNAMFRPAPPHSQDDGPPSGLMELLGKK